MDLGKNIQQTIDLYFKNFGTLFVAGLVALIVSGITCGILAGPVLGGFMILCLKVKRGEQAEFNEIFAHFDKFVPTLIIAIISGAAMMIAGIIPFLGILIGLVVNPIIMLVMSFSILMVIEKNLEFMDAIKQSIETIKTDLVMYWVYGLIIMIMGGVGAIACLIGVLATIPLTHVGAALAYSQLSESSAPTNPSIPV